MTIENSTTDIKYIITFGLEMLNLLMSQSKKSSELVENIDFLVNNIPFLYQIYNAKSSQLEIMKPVGLPNCGNICYLNSSIQQ
jgi:ubiquitin C-terminal hydrolase